MERIGNKGTYEVETVSDMGMIIQRFDNEGADCEIAFIIEDSSSEEDEARNYVVISKQETRELIAALEELTKE